VHGDEVLNETVGFVAIIHAAVDAQPDVQPIDPVPQRQQNVPQREAVFAAANGDEDAFIGREHVVFLDEALRLLVDPFDIMRAAKRQFVLPHVDDGFFATMTALQQRMKSPGHGLP